MLKGVMHCKSLCKLWPKMLASSNYTSNMFCNRKRKSGTSFTIEMNHWTQMHTHKITTYYQQSQITFDIFVVPQSLPSGPDIHRTSSPMNELKHVKDEEPLKGIAQLWNDIRYLRLTVCFHDCSFSIRVALVAFKNIFHTVWKKKLKQCSKKYTSAMPCDWIIT